MGHGHGHGSHARMCMRLTRSMHVHALPHRYGAVHGHPDARTHGLLADALMRFWDGLAHALLPAPTSRAPAGRGSRGGGGDGARHDGAAAGGAPGPGAMAAPLRAPWSTRWADFDLVCQEPLASYDPVVRSSAGDGLGGSGVRLVRGNWSLYAAHALSLSATPCDTEASRVAFHVLRLTPCAWRAAGTPTAPRSPDGSRQAPRGPRSSLRWPSVACRASRSSSTRATRGLASCTRCCAPRVSSARAARAESPPAR